jgi:chemotaxis protein CheD
MKVSSNPGDVIVTYSLGSCIGLTLYDPVAQVGGMIHCMLPLSKIDPARAVTNPEMFADTGIPLLIQTLYDMGAQKKRLIAKVAGASSLLDERGTFKIGERNYLVLRKVLWKNEILIAAEDVGGTLARTLYLHIRNGYTLLRAQGGEYLLGEPSENS